jgi:hypothetical protein
MLLIIVAVVVAKNWPSAGDPSKSDGGRDPEYGRRDCASCVLERHFYRRAYYEVLDIASHYSDANWFEMKRSSVTEGERELFADIYGRVSEAYAKCISREMYRDVLGDLNWPLVSGDRQDVIDTVRRCNKCKQSTFYLHLSYLVADHIGNCDEDSRDRRLGLGMDRTGHDWSTQEKSDSEERYRRKLHRLLSILATCCRQEIPRRRPDPYPYSPYSPPQPHPYYPFRPSNAGDTKGSESGKNSPLSRQFFRR